MEGIMCRGGETQILKVLRHVREEHADAMCRRAQLFEILFEAIPGENNSVDFFLRMAAVLLISPSPGESHLLVGRQDRRRLLEHQGRRTPAIVW
jgi:hypothetical protein